VHDGFGLFDEGGGKEWWKERGEWGKMLLGKHIKLLGGYNLGVVVNKIKA
jgi:hypothetical protein